MKKDLSDYLIISISGAEVESLNSIIDTWEKRGQR